MKGVAKAGLLAAALAGTTDAFQTPMSLRPVPGAHGSSIKNVAQAPSLRKAAKQSSRTATMLFGPSFSKVGDSKGSSELAKVAEVSDQPSLLHATMSILAADAGAPCASRCDVLRLRQKGEGVGI
jgi:hypothetical protein